MLLLFISMTSVFGGLWIFSFNVDSIDENSVSILVFDKIIGAVISKQKNIWADYSRFKI